MIIKKIGILGGSGFVGATLANHLSAEGHKLKVLTRNREANRHNMILLPQLDLVQTDIHDQEALSAGLSDCDVVVNLVGILNERGRKGSGFHKAHVELTDKVIKACQENNIQRVLHMSALNADAINGASHYLRTKGEAENNIHAAEGLHVTSFRPSVIFGKDDRFFNRFSAFIKLSPIAFPLACAKARFAPIYVEDVAAAMICTLNNPAHYGRRYDLCGPDSYTLQELVEFTAACIGKKRMVLPLPDPVARVQGLAFDLSGFLFHALGIEQPFSTDNYLSTRMDSVCECNDMTTLGITPANMKAIVPTYLANQTQRGKYDAYRQGSRRESL